MSLLDKIQNLCKETERSLLEIKLTLSNTPGEPAGEDISAEEIAEALKFLHAEHAEIREQINALHAGEPEEDTTAYDRWEARLELFEDQLDEIEEEIEQLEELRAESPETL